MAEIHGKQLDHKIGSVAVEENTKQVSLAIDQDVADVTGATDSAKESLVGLYGWTMDGDYNWNPVAAKNDATIYAQLAVQSNNVQVVPGGGTVSADNPIYKGNAILKSYQITVPIDGAITCRAGWTGSGVISRLTSGTF